MTAGRVAAGSDGICHVCGGTRFAHRAVLWPGLIDDWGLSADEVRIVDEQQGTHCVECGSNVRSIAIARALCWHYGFQVPLKAFVEDPAGTPPRVLEINEAGTLHPFLSRMRGHHLATYPAVDMLAMPYETGAFDLIVHSDTLEHVEDPVAGLRECRRVLADAGVLVFTVPTLAGRLTRSRAGLPASYHGAAETHDPQMLVHTEFGADVWAMVLGAGYSTCSVVSYRFPAGLAFVARP